MAQHKYLMCFTCRILWMPSLPGLQSNVLVGAAPYALPTHIPTLAQVFRMINHNQRWHHSGTCCVGWMICVESWQLH